MKAIKSLFFTLGALGFAATAPATVTINIKTAGWGNNTAASNGMAWGIVVDSDGNATNGDFSGAFLDALVEELPGFTLPGGADFSTPVLLFDEYYFVPARNTTTDSGPAGEKGFMNDLGLILDSPVGSGDDYGLIWFSTGSGTLSASHYFGFQAMGTLPADGATVTPESNPSLATRSIAGGPSLENWYADAKEIQPEGWLRYDWFKGFKPDAGSNWIFHGRHGWFFVIADDTSSMFLWDEALGRWMFTNATVYPWMYAYGPDEGWVFFFEGGSPGKRFFQRGDTGAVVSEQELRANP